MRTGPSNPRTQELIQQLKEQSHKQNAPVWKKIAGDLEKPTRNRRSVNLSKISRYTKENDEVVVPGKVLGSGELNHKVTISAFAVSGSALEKIKSSGNYLTLIELMKKNPKGKNLVVIG